jgi:hypothetical protein
VRVTLSCLDALVRDGRRFRQEYEARPWAFHPAALRNLARRAQRARIALDLINSLASDGDGQE